MPENDQPTPTTDAVRHAYASFHPEAGEMFDRWLAARDRENRAIGWDDGFEAGFDFVDHTPRGISIDPPMNPYRGDNR